VLVWWPEPGVAERLVIVCLFALLVYAPFYLALFTTDRYGGSNYDPNGYPPVKVKLLGRTLSFDLNITAFTVYSILLAIAFVLIQIAETDA
jgi:hypothetical protein